MSAQVCVKVFSEPHLPPRQDPHICSSRCSSAQELNKSQVMLSPQTAIAEGRGEHPHQLQCFVFLTQTSSNCPLLIFWGREGSPGHLLPSSHGGCQVGREILNTSLNFLNVKKIFTGPTCAELSHQPQRQTRTLAWCCLAHSGQLNICGFPAEKPSGRLMPKNDSSGAETVREPGHREGRSLPVYSFPSVLQPEI